MIRGARSMAAPTALTLYRALIPAAAGLLAPDGVLALEFGLGQGEEVAALLRAASFGRFAFRLDLNGRRRIISARPALSSALRFRSHERPAGDIF